ncbi:hypothetical protein [Flavobacterium indicum]|nr:hypothetical protein [Flavobacterium indicum]
MSNVLKDASGVIYSFIDALTDYKLKEEGAPKEVRDEINPLKN